jgi:exodeoxyribonuclease V beta subunit
MKAIPHLPFNALEAELDRRNLIEASAGTGKTYSIALLVLRLLLEKRNEDNSHLKIDQILMVTFTNPAVAELETRIRLFIRTAHRISSHPLPDDDPALLSIVKRSIDKIGQNETTELLKNAVLTMDETSILTIHSFCQRLLSEYAFDTRQIFGAQALTSGDFDLIVEEAGNQFWRTYITSLKLRVLEILQNYHLSRHTFIQMAKTFIGGKKIWIKEAYDDDITENGQQRFLDAFEEKENEIQILKQSQLQWLRSEKDRLKNDAKKHPSAKKWELEDPGIFERTEDLLELVLSKKSAQYVNALFQDVLVMENEIDRLKQESHQLVACYFNKISQFAVLFISQLVNHQKEKNSFMSFDDMIVKVRDAVMHNAMLCEAVRAKYKAVFIDEFQDTDKLQYEIFNALFSTETVLFYIGDPKQSIYAFRKADINTYFKAKTEGVDRILEMNTNYRSAPQVIEALNAFFKPAPDFDTFFFSGNNESIDYIEVIAPAGSDMGSLKHNDNDVPPITTMFFNLKPDLDRAVASLVADLLREKYVISKKDKSEKVKPSDIGILVRNKTEGQQIKRLLAQYKIPSVTIDDEKVLRSQEAKAIFYVLNAILSMEKEKIHRALLTDLTGITITELRMLNEEAVLTLFKHYQQTLLKTGQGVYVTIMKFIKDFHVREKLLADVNDNGERKLSNLLQLVELLHTMQNRKEYAPHELVNWLGKGIEGKVTEGDEFEQRIENDEDAVKIITIHKSKGLEYNIVIAPYLDLDTQIKQKSTLAEFRSEKDGEYYFDYKGDLSPECDQWREMQAEQENRRLLYVALTRAKYKCFVMRYNKKRGGSTISNFINAIDESTRNGIQNFIVPGDIDVTASSGFIYTNQKQQYPIVYKKAVNFTLQDVDWKKMSYSGLNPEHIPSAQTNSSAVNSGYDRFIFEELRKGAHTGNLLHYIFENADFADQDQWRPVIAQGIRRLSAKMDDKGTEGLIEMMKHITSTNLPCSSGSFQLSSVNMTSRLNELEFDFPVQRFNPDLLVSLCPANTPWQIKNSTSLQGIMNGKMDLFFEHDGRYYILDWKSNHLGNTLEDYTKEKVWAAMAANNYHLQYHIYTVALCLYLRLRLPDFDYHKHFGGVIYLFVRGIRENDDKGIFTHKPDEKLINELLTLLTP